MPWRPVFRRFALVAALLAATGQAATAVAHGEAHEHAAEHLRAIASADIAEGHGQDDEHHRGHEHGHDDPPIGGAVHLAAPDAAALAADPHGAHDHGEIGNALKGRADVVAGDPPQRTTLPSPALSAARGHTVSGDVEAPPVAASRRATKSRAPPRA